MTTPSSRLFAPDIASAAIPPRERLRKIADGIERDEELSIFTKIRELAPQIRDVLSGNTPTAISARVDALLQTLDELPESLKANNSIDLFSLTATPPDVLNATRKALRELLPRDTQPRELPRIWPS